MVNCDLVIDRLGLGGSSVFHIISTGLSAMREVGLASFGEGPSFAASYAGCVLALRLLYPVSTGLSVNRSLYGLYLEEPLPTTVLACRFRPSSANCWKQAAR